MKNIIIGLIIIAALAGGWFVWSNASDDEAVRPAGMNDTQTDSTMSDSSNNLLNLIQYGGNQTCTYSYSDDDDNSVIMGEVYVSGDKMRSNYEVVEDNQAFTGSMIRDVDYMYVWGSNMPEGVKMKFDVEEMLKDIENSQYDSDIQSQNPTPIDPTMDMDFECSSWTVDQSVFTPPSDVNFRDMSALMENLPNGLNIDNACAVCDNVPDDAKAACLESLNCN